MRKLSLSLLLIIVLTYSCRKTGVQSPQWNNSSEQPSNNTNNRNNSISKRIYVKDTAELYAAVSNEENAGSTIVLEPGTYFLAPKNYIAEGRLELQENMSLIGKPGNPEAVVVDVSALKQASVTPGNGTLRTGAIRMGDGDNSIEWMTLKSNGVNKQ